MASAVALINSSNNLLNDSYVEATDTGFSTARKDIGIYFLCQTCSGNVALRDQVLNGQYGVIINTATGPGGAKLDSSAIYNNGCDSVTIVANSNGGAPSGTVVNNQIHDNGPVCANGNIPGGGIYSAGNSGGFVLNGNTSSNNCGIGIDLDNVSGATITNNTLTSPGNSAWRSSCVGQIALSLADVRNSTVQGNYAENVGRPSNELGNQPDVNHFYEDTNATWFTDLPAGIRTVVAAQLVTRKTSMLATDNTISGNRFVASCSAPCVGVGLFASRGTGFGPGGAWSAATTNYFTSNSVVGSNWGSRRGGGNWFAASTTCTSAASPAPCNDDDYQHNAPVGNWARDDVGYTLYS